MRCAGPTELWTGPRPITSRWSLARFTAARRRVLVASAAASDANSSSNSPGRDKEREEVLQMEKEKGAASLLMSQKSAMLKQQLALAAQFEDYKEAARLRDSLRPFEEDPVLRLHQLMKKAIEEERFELTETETLRRLCVLQVFYDDDGFAHMLTELPTLQWMHDSFSPIHGTKISEEVLGTQGCC